MAWIQAVVLAMCASLVMSKDIAWQKPGCHKVGTYGKSVSNSLD